MPEMPEVETISRSLQGILPVGVVSVARSAKPMRYQSSQQELDRLSGQVIHTISRRGRYLRLAFQTHDLWLHFGMSGWLRIELPGSLAETQAMLAAPQHDHLSLELAGGAKLILNDARRFGGYLLVASNQTPDFIARLGPEVFAEELTHKVFYASLRLLKMPIKLALMDNATLTGIGNIYACEALFQARIHPARASNTLSHPEVERLLNVSRSILGNAIDMGGSTLRDFKHVNGQSGKAQNLHQVYGREGEPCVSNPAHIIARIEQGGRSTYYCPQCQKQKKLARS